ncbi:MAG: signal peptidase II [Lentisphaerota bacterium]
MLVLLTGLLIAILDQATKQIVRLDYTIGESHVVIDGLFSLTYVRNTGAAWGIFGGQNTALTVLSIIMLILMVVFRRSFLSRTWEHNLALGFMVGGIVGNLMDRLRLGWVTDFFDFYWNGHHFPVFNIADAAICTGVGLYILSSLWVASHPLHESQLKSMLDPSPVAVKPTDGQS